MSPSPPQGRLGSSVGVHGQTDRQSETNRQTDRHTERQRDRETEFYTVAKLTYVCIAFIVVAFLLLPHAFYAFCELIHVGIAMIGAN